MNKISILALATAMLAGSFAYAPAQTAQPAPEQPTMQEGDGPGRHHGRRGGGRGMMRMIDANGDGVISEDEASALAERSFMRLDRDGDGNVTEAEFVSVGNRGRGFWSSWFGDEERAAVENVRKQKFAALDTDKNGSMSKAEFFAEAKARLIAADADKDGKVTPWEYRAAN